MNRVVLEVTVGCLLVSFLACESSDPSADGANGGGNSPKGGQSAMSSTEGGATGGVKNPSGTGANAQGGSSLVTSTSTDVGVSGCQEATCGSHKWACWKMPTPPSEQLPTAQRYTDLGNGAVRDDITCLVWEKANPNTPGTLQDSIDRCAALSASLFAGYGDWRLPTRIEMASITDVTLGRTGYSPIFATTSGYYMTGSDWYKTILTDNDTTAGNETNLVWGYGTNGFTSNAIRRTDTNLVARCVRGNGSGEAQGQYATEPPNHYAISNGEVTDNYTGLVWQQGYSPALLSHEEAVNYCATLSLNGHTGFRVPALNELATTVNEAKVGGAVVDLAFPGNPVGCKDPKYWFWAVEAYGNSNFWGLSYCDGFTGYNAGTSGTWNYFPTANVRCVR